MSFNPKEHMMKIGYKDKAQEYLEVKWRLVWFREMCPEGTIETEMIHLDLDRPTQDEQSVWDNQQRKMVKVLKEANGFVIFRAIVTDGKGGKAIGTKSEKAAAFPDYIEKCESGAVGRALAMLGYGTQFTGDELAEHHRIVDSPVDHVEHPTITLGSIKTLAQRNVGIADKAQWQVFVAEVLGQYVPEKELTSEHLQKLFEAVNKQPVTA